MVLQQPTVRVFYVKKRARCWSYKSEDHKEFSLVEKTRHQENTVVKIYHNKCNFKSTPKVQRWHARQGNNLWNIVLPIPRKSSQSLGFKAKTARMNRQFMGE